MQLALSVLNIQALGFSVKFQRIFLTPSQQNIFLRLEISLIFPFFCLPVATFDFDTFQNDLKDGICHCHSATHTVKNDVTVLYSFSLWTLYHLSLRVTITTPSMLALCPWRESRMLHQCSQTRRMSLSKVVCTDVSVQWCIHEKSLKCSAAWAAYQCLPALKHFLSLKSHPCYWSSEPGALLSGSTLCRSSGMGYIWPGESRSYCLQGKHSLLLFYAIPGKEQRPALPMRASHLLIMRLVVQSLPAPWARY